jgi:protein-ribulosamine 3-kinase
MNPSPEGRQTAHALSSLAIARVFGGIPKSFYRAYHDHFPKSEPKEDYEARGNLYELFHYLNHTVLFGVRLELSPALNHT